MKKIYNKIFLENLDLLLDLLPEYIDMEYPKGIAKDRGQATVHITKFLLHVKNVQNLNEKSC